MANHDQELRLQPALRGARMAARPAHAEDELGALREALRRSEERMSTMLDSIADGFLIIQRDWRIAYISERAEAMLRTAPGPEQRAGTLGRNFWAEFPALRGTVLETQCRQAMEGGGVAGFELYYRPSQRWLEVRAAPCIDGLACHLQDITERKISEQALRDSANRLHIALAAGRLGDWSWDAATNLVTLGARAADIVDLPGGQPITWTALRERLTDEDRDLAQAALEHAIAARTDYHIECRIERGGERRWLALVGHGNYGAHHRLLGMTGMVQDITARKAAEDSLRQSEEELRALANSIPQLAWIARVDGTMTWYNERWYAYTGTTAEQVAGDNWHIAYDPACVPHMVAHWERSVRSGLPFEMEFPIRGADGQFRWFLTRANPVRDSAGQLSRWFGTSTDVDQVKRVQEALRDESNVLELLNDTGTALAGTLDLRTLLQAVTDAANRIGAARVGGFFYQAEGGAHGLSLHATSGAPADVFGGLTQADGAPLFGPGWQAAGAQRIADLCAVRPGHPRWLLPPGETPLRSYLSVPVLSRSGAPIGCLVLAHPEPSMFSERTERILGGIAAQAAVAIDNTRLYEAAQRAAEERKILLDSERSARTVAERSNQMKDEFLATLSHELRTPLSAILGWAQVLRRGTRDEADLHRGLQTIERNARAQAQLIEDLLDMSRITSGKVLLDMQLMAPATAVEAAVEAVRSAAQAKNIRLENDFEPSAGAIMGDPSRLQQVFWNLLSNAIKFTPRDGAVRIGVRQVDQSIHITVSDTGIGIAAEFLAHAFERFRQADASTTRKHGGLGLGLSIVQHLIEQHGGTVQVSSDGENRGACFTVQLPLASAKAGAMRQARNPPPPAPVTDDSALHDLSGLKVLVVDDEADARELVERIMSDCQAKVLSASNAAEALQLLHSARFDILISDIGMPGVDGFELLSRVRALGPALGGAIPAVALTAFARSEDRLRALNCGFQAHVAKPVEPAQLINTVARLMAPRGQ
ncbi:MAG: ATP-binding protein [Pseudomonadota bacterium]